tara:strand:+ start:311 stop:457 length:147 start_codon:yes stop_codon:yes gene_type:complete
MAKSPSRLKDRAVKRAISNLRENKKDRKAILNDYINMLNLHLQDRLFF